MIDFKIIKENEMRVDDIEIEEKRAECRWEIKNLVYRGGVDKGKSCKWPYYLYHDDDAPYDYRLCVESSSGALDCVRESSNVDDIVDYLYPLPR